MINESFKNIEGYEIDSLPFYFQKEKDSDIDRHICICVTYYKEGGGESSLDNKLHFVVRHFWFNCEISKEAQDRILEQICRNIKDYGIWDKCRLYPPGGIKFLAIDAAYAIPNELWIRSLND
ncbi:hypothetical protein M0R19_06025 [Candidatus Pacearchaeota archaeon]|jgi:hypothetical protein|nr:hypothetical protein [Candidatus Pacearchaeota archaeon]